MTDTGKTILVERKFSIYTSFLDTVLQSEGVIQDGETRQQALIRVHDELVGTAQVLRNRFEAGNPTTMGTDNYKYTPLEKTVIPVVEVEFRNGQQDTLDGIKSAQTMEELSTYHKLSSNNKELYDAYCLRLKELTNAEIR